MQSKIPERPFEKAAGKYTNISKYGYLEAAAAEVRGDYHLSFKNVLRGEIAQH